LEELHKHEHSKHWQAVANAHANQPQGSRYRRAFNAIIKDQESWVPGINDTTRMHCYWLVDNLAAVQVWRETLTFDRLLPHLD
jgi:hypothetical protein